jgi:hypothetical protein
MSRHYCNGYDLFVDLCIYSCPHLFILSLIYLLINCLFVCLFTYSLINLFIYLYVSVFTYLFDQEIADSTNIVLSIVNIAEFIII